MTEHEFEPWSCNCFLATYALARHRAISSVILVRTVNPAVIVPYHVAAMTRGGHVVHFRSYGTNPSNFWWFRGRYNLCGLAVTERVFMTRLAYRLRLGRWRTLGYLRFAVVLFWLTLKRLFRR